MMGPLKLDYEKTYRLADEPWDHLHPVHARDGLMLRCISNDCPTRVWDQASRKTMEVLSGKA